MASFFVLIRQEQPKKQRRGLPFFEVAV